jgi:hypothetical protein
MRAPAALLLASASLFLSAAGAGVTLEAVQNVLPTPPTSGLGAGTFAGSASAPPGTTPGTTLAGTPVNGTGYPTEQALIGCSQQFCGGSCEFVPLGNAPKDTCVVSAASFVSGMAWSPDGSALKAGVRSHPPFCARRDRLMSGQVFAGTSNCGQAAQLPSVNLCFNFLNNGAPASFSNFFLA